MMTVPKPDPRALKLMVEQAFLGSIIGIVFVGVFFFFALGMRFYIVEIGGLLYSMFPHSAFSYDRGRFVYAVISLVIIMASAVGVAKWYLFAKDLVTEDENDA